MARDMRGTEFKVGQEVAKGITLNQQGSTGIKICKVTRIDGDKVYIDDSSRPMKFADRLLILA